MLSTHLDEDVEPLPESDVGAHQVGDEATQLFVELVHFILDINQCGPVRGEDNHHLFTICKINKSWHLVFKWSLNDAILIQHS